MNRNDLFRSFSDVDDEVLLRSEQPPTAHRARIRIRLAAATLALFLCVFGCAVLLHPGNPDNAPSTWFIVTAYAVNGDRVELGANNDCFNSGVSSGVSDGTIFDALFPADVPLFQFTVEPARTDNDRYFDLAVAYNGIPLESMESKHLVVFHIMPRSGSEGLYSYEIVGWCEEKADIAITVTDKERGEIVEALTVHVRYDVEVQAYQLTAAMDSVENS